MKKIILLLNLLFISAFANSASGDDTKHREHGAHVHGAGTLAIAFDEAKGKVEFRGAAEGVLGFEHKARSVKDKKTLAEAVAQFTNNIGKMLIFDPSLHCQFAKETVGQVPEKGEEGSGEHSDWAANYSVSCDRSPLGTKMTVDFSAFKRLHDLDITVLVGALQKSAEFKSQPVIIDLKTEQ